MRYLHSHCESRCGVKDQSVSVDTGPKGRGRRESHVTERAVGRLHFNPQTHAAALWADWRISCSGLISFRMQAQPGHHTICNTIESVCV